MNILRKSLNPFSKLKALLANETIPKYKEQLNKIKKEFGNRTIAEVKVDQVISGMREIPGLYYEGSQLDAQSGITFRGHSIPQVEKHSQKAQGGQQPLPESMIYLLLTGEFPNKQQFDDLQQELRSHGDLTDQESRFITSIPKDTHPMTMLSMAILFLQRKSKFFEQYDKGMKKGDYWAYYYDDTMSLLNKIPQLAAIIYRHRYKEGKLIPSNSKLDWAGNYSHMLGYESHEMKECIRGYLTIHADHEGGNVSAHTAHLVGSALADPYLSYAAAVNGLAGPLHGLANQECLKWLIDLKKFHNGKAPNKETVVEFVNKTLGEGRVIPGYGHAVLRNTDPRFLHLQNFAKRHIKNDEIVELVRVCYQTIPAVLGKMGKIKNPYPNVDAHSGACLQHFGMVEYRYYTVVFAVSRAIGCLTNGVWSRAFGLPIERPNSVDMAWIREHAGKEAPNKATPKKEASNKETPNKEAPRKETLNR